ncbi:T9SS type A sorting domain-containing protein [Chryseobacterium sp. RJ-7-14]|uniref:T9SS type A sorting domain-containing protein n=2 Tax=Chryseobacterium cheonjiense TaxID=2728845 RepID=A0A7Y0A8H0_9FLAO|nr:T9SS type A sorting domain-containing protein [Chryseobacterium cheonjiense]
MKKILYGGFLVILPSLFQAQLFITEVYRDTPYSEYIDANDPVNQNPSPELYEKLRKRHRGEFVEIFNASDKGINLKDWSLMDDEGSYNFPNKIIPSGQYIVVAANNNEVGDYFPYFFSTTQGKQNQILYQKDIKLNNSNESLRLIARKILGNDIDPPYATSSFVYPVSSDFGIAGGSSNVIANPSIFYDVRDWQYGYSTPQIPTPLAGSITPPIKPFEEYVDSYLLQNYSLMTWDDNVSVFLSTVCNISIPSVSQTPNTGVTSGGKSFTYDEAGNSSASSTYTSGGNSGGISSGYTGDEIDQIKAAIQLSPNPTYSIVNVNITGIAQGKVASVQVFSSTGAILFTKNNLQSTTNFNFSFDLSGQITGVYIANFTLTTGQVVGKNVLKY